MATIKLSEHRSSNCYVIKNDNTVTFVSYKTPVVFIDKTTATVTFGRVCCTRSTIRQVGWFLKEYLPDVSYQLAKQLYLDGYKYNYETGELTPVD